MVYRYSWIAGVAAIALARAWRLTWAVRAAMMVVGFGALAILADRDALPFRGPEAGVLLVPVAVGTAEPCSDPLETLASDRARRGCNRRPVGHVSFGPCFEERFEHKPTIQHSRVRDREAGLMNGPTIGENEIQVERSRAPPCVADASSRPFDHQQLAKQATGGSRGLDHYNGVEVRTLVGTTNWRGLVHRGLRHDP